MNNFFFLIFFLLSSGISNGQRFWLLTDEFPYGDKTGITGVKDSILFVCFSNGVMKSLNEGTNWQKVLSSGPVHSIYASETGNVIAGGEGKIYFSNDFALTWDSVSLDHSYPIIKIISDIDGELFAITGLYTDEDGFIGAGVFHSFNNGHTWLARNTGLGNYLYIDQIAIDKNNRLYITSRDEYVSGNAGLFYSDSKGSLWSHIKINIDGRNSIPDNVSVLKTTCLVVSPADSLYISVNGTAVNVEVSLNLVKHISDVLSDSYWNVKTISNTYWWLNKTYNDLHFAKNGDYYSSLSGTLSIGGSLFSRDKGVSWYKHHQGLGVDVSGRFNTQKFYELSTGKVFMIKDLDERIYWADTSRVNAIRHRDFLSGDYQLFPNPASNGKVKLILPSGKKANLIKILDASGKIVLENIISTTEIYIDCPRIPGFYYVVIYDGIEDLITSLIVW
ncbi:MAG: T9SS type A sorting domain-containing protein [Cytophagaceae bacterium]